MKKAKVFLASALLVVAVTGAIATKAKTFVVTEYYLDDNSACQSIQLTSTTCKTGGDGCKATITGASRQLYNENSCTTTLKN